MEPTADEGPANAKKTRRGSAPTLSTSPNEPDFVKPTIPRVASFTMLETVTSVMHDPVNVHVPDYGGAAADGSRPARGSRASSRIMMLISSPRVSNESISIL